MNIEELYENEQFNNLLVYIASLKKIVAFDDYRQDVFLEIVDKKCKTMNDYKKAANRVAKRYYDNKSFDMDVMSLAYENENGEIETDDEVMARLVYSGKGRYV